MMAFIVDLASGRLDLVAPLARFLGQCGIVLFACQAALGFRSAVSLVTSDVLAVNRLHQRLGRYGMLLVLVHPLLLLAATRGSVLAMVAPRFDDSTAAIASFGPIALLM